MLARAGPARAACPKARRRRRRSSLQRLRPWSSKLRRRQRPSPLRKLRRRQRWSFRGTGAACSTPSIPAIGRPPAPASPRFRRACSRPSPRPSSTPPRDRRPVDLASLQALIAEAPELPQADQLARLAIARGATTAPLIIPQRRVVNLGSPPGRYRARPVQGEPLADELRTALEPLVKANDAAGAEAQLLTYAPQLSVEARAEAAQRVAWIYYVNGYDAEARRVADTWRQGAVGDWAPQAAWVSGLASWRLGDCNAASRRFPAGRADRAAARASRRRALLGRAVGTGVPPSALGRAAARAAASSPESFYGLVAREALGMETKLPADPFIGAIRRSPIFPTSGGPRSWPGSARRRSPRNCFATRPRSARRRSIMP